MKTPAELFAVHTPDRFAGELVDGEAARSQRLVSCGQFQTEVHQVVIEPRENHMREIENSLRDWLRKRRLGVEALGID